MIEFKRVTTMLLLSGVLVLGINATEIDIYDIWQVRGAALSDFESAETIAINAANAENKGDLTASISLYETALQIATDPQWYYALGSLYFDIGEMHQSAVAFELAASTHHSQPYYCYYNAACAESIAQNTYASLAYLEQALMAGYNHWSHLNSDSDLEFVRKDPGFEILTQRYQVPQQISSPDDLNVLDPSWMHSITTDIDGDQVDELVVLLTFTHSWLSEMLGTYQLYLYQKSAYGWQYINMATDSIEEVVSSPSKINVSFFQTKIVFNGGDTEYSYPFIIGDLDGHRGLEIVLLAMGRSYYDAKVYLYQNERLHCSGNIEGFEEIVSSPLSLGLIGHKVTDTALFDGKSEEYSYYTLANGSLVQSELPGVVMNEVAERKRTKFTQDPDAYNLSSYYWFLYNNMPGEINQRWYDSVNEALYKGRYESDLLEYIGNRHDF